MPVSRADTDIAVLQIESVKSLPCPDPHCVIERGGEFRVEAQVGIRCAVVPLAKMKHFGAWEHVPDVEGFTPTWMGDDDVWCEPLLLQREQDAQHALPMQNGTLHLPQIGVLLWMRRAVRGVTKDVETRDARGSVPTDTDDLQVRTVCPVLG